MIIKCPKCSNQIESATIPDSEGLCSNCAHPLAGEFSGGCIDDFQVLAELGRGNNGAVFLALQHGTSREVALKIMLESVLDDSGVIGFFKEARVVASLNHPNIVQAIAAGQLETGNFYFAMELVDGPSIESLLDLNGAIGYVETLRIGSLIAYAMDYAWRNHKLIHSDIKPGNIILQNGKTPKLADLGLARFDKEPVIELMVTPLYAPPEVIQSKFELMDFKSDIYSFGATLYEMFSGSPPFPGGDIDLVLKMQLEQRPTALTTKLGLFEAEVSNFIEKMLAKSPERRPNSWGEVGDFLAFHYQNTQK